MINPFEFLLPTKIRYGAGSIQVLGEELKALNAKNIMVITDKGLSKSEVMEKLTAILKREAFCLHYL
jgi:alcohol dehydrogenase